MRLNANPFERIRLGKKTIEIRLFDEKRQEINLNDIIEFLMLPEMEEKILVEVRGLLRYKTFSDLLNDFSMSNFGYSDKYHKSEFMEQIYETYTREEEEKYGVLGIRIKVIK
jgi:ASC-1-like (ASCH) protein